jgi:mutator protein MutT
MSNPKDIIKFCPKCGSSQFPFQGEKSFLCASCGFHFFINSAAAVAAIIENEKGEVLLTIRAEEPQKGFLDLPGGFVDPKETVEECLKREIKEELNLTITDIEYLTSYPNEYVFSGYTVYTVDLGFVCKAKGFDKMHVKDDIAGFHFLTREEIDYGKIGAGSIRKLLKYYYNNKNK